MSESPFRCRRRFRFWLYPLISLTVILGLCFGRPMVGQAISWADLILRGLQVIQLSTLTDQQEVAIGQQINQQLSQQVQILQSPELQRYISQIGRRLAAESTRPQIPYTFQVVADNNINAFATMGGFVYVNSGLIKAADNEAELASVLAHEIGHIAGRHSVNQMKEMAIARGLVGAAGLNRNTAVNLGLELALRRPNSRNDEFLADQMGITTLGRSGYAQRGAITFMSKLMRRSPLPAFFSTHPSTADRVQRMQAMTTPGQVDMGKGLDSAAYRATVLPLLPSAVPR